MRKTVVFVFAHPDDEAFGPGGTIAKFSRTDDTYILCATGGEKGKNSLKTKVDLALIRKKELLASSKILGVKRVYFLGFEDGTLSNSLYHKLAKKIETKFKELQPDTVITYEPHGISGHIDHITVSFVTTFVFNKLKTIPELYYFCNLETARTKEERDKYFVYSPKGYKKDEIDWENNTEEFWELKLKAMHAHASQLHDAKRIIRRQEGLPKREYFIKFKD